MRIPERFNPVTRICKIDITRVLLLELSRGLSTDFTPDINCRLISDSHLREMVHDPEFQITSRFIDDFQRLGFTGVTVSVNSQFAGVLFLVSQIAAARHNSGGSAFNGIALDLPDGVFYLFKVFVRPQFRGNRMMATMLHYAAEHLKPAGLRCIVTTTHWQNADFLKSAEKIGFTRCGFATEVVLASRHFYQLPKPFRPDGASKRSDDDERLSIRFLRPSHDYS